jgi:quinol monooxygenase YgiN
MYGLIAKMTAHPGQRDALQTILLEIGGGMPGCMSYVIAQDPADADALWITEVWDDQASHAASLTLPVVQSAIARGRPLIAGFSNRVVTTPVGGIGLASRPSTRPDVR